MHIPFHNLYPMFSANLTYHCPRPEPYIPNQNFYTAFCFTESQVSQLNHRMRTTLIPFTIHLT